MKIYHNIEDFAPLTNAIVTSGTFDGVHLGHQLILSRLKETAKNQNGETVVITFWPHPRLIVSPDSDGILLLSTLEEKIELLENFGINHLLILPFTRKLSELSGHDYVEKILLKGIGTKTLVIGYDHRFGKNREGGFDFLKNNTDKYKIDIVEIPRQEIENLTISSTKIRKALLQGRIEEAKGLLGRNYSFSGLVKKGRQLGRTIGFPTANVHTEKTYKLIPSKGVYAVKVYLRDKMYKGVMNIGSRPTVEGEGITQEVHILDFDDDIYGEKLKVEIISFLRSEKKFNDIKELVKQIRIDCDNAKTVFEIT